ncbi:MAG: hypothetical protein GF353_00830 [Candidatus Lokiarchaeota archaeon]|nr:hypothetical protein [Candidatus Lokiarchaeota archaeon]
MKRDPALRWLIINLVHSILAMLICWWILFRQIDKIPFLNELGFSSFQASVIVGIAVYLIFWMLYPLRFYRRMFSTMLGIFAIATISIAIGISSAKFKLFFQVLQGHQALYICWSVIMLVLLIFDFKSRNPHQPPSDKTYRSGGFSLKAFLRNKFTIILLIIFAFALLLFGPG